MSIECDWKTIEHEDGSRTSYCSYSNAPGAPWEDAFERWGAHDDAWAGQRLRGCSPRVRGRMGHSEVEISSAPTNGSRTAQRRPLVRYSAVPPFRRTRTAGRAPGTGGCGATLPLSEEAFPTGILNPTAGGLLAGSPEEPAPTGAGVIRAKKSASSVP